MPKLIVSSLVAMAVVVGATADANAHCQVPCGIYDDHARIHQMLEDVATIAKAVTQIAELAGKTDAQSMNQMVRWINTKETHASKIIDTVAVYFLTQKLKPSDKNYVAKLKDHHTVMQAAMTTKQTVDQAAVDALRASVKGLEKHWPKKK